MVALQGDFLFFFPFRSSSRIQSEASGLYGRYRVFDRLRFTDIPSAVFAPSSTQSFWFYFLLVFFASLFPFSSSSADLSLFSFFLFFSRPAHISCLSRHKLFWCFFFYLFVYETYTFFFPYLTLVLSNTYISIYIYLECEFLVLFSERRCCFLSRLTYLCKVMTVHVGETTSKTLL